MHRLNPAESPAQSLAKHFAKPLGKSPEKSFIISGDQCRTKCLGSNFFQSLAIMFW